MFYGEVLPLAVNLFIRTLIAQIIKIVTTIPVIIGMKIAMADKVIALPDSSVEIAGFPNPPVVNDDVALVTPVSAWIVPATPPPAIIANVHFISGEISVITEAIKTAPAITAIGEVIVSKALSTQGIKYPAISKIVAAPKVTSAGTVPIQLKLSDNVKLPVRETMLKTRNGIKILNPLAALSPIPIKIVSNISKFISMTPKYF
jgi:hypothetical protein